MTAAHLQAMRDGKAAADEARMLREDAHARAYLQYLRYEADAFSQYIEAEEPAVKNGEILSRSERPMYDAWRNAVATNPGAPTDSALQRIREALDHNRPVFNGVE